MPSRTNRRGEVTKRFEVKDRDAFPDALGRALDDAGFEIEAGGIRAEGGKVRAYKRSRIPDFLVEILPLEFLGLGTEFRLDSVVKPSLNEGDDRLFCELRVRPFYEEDGSFEGPGGLGEAGGVTWEPDSTANLARARRHLDRVARPLVEGGVLGASRPRKG